jgi:hypothetical protein
MKLKHDVDHFRGKHSEIFTKLFKKKRHEKAKKIMVHPIRTCQFALQLLEKGTATFDTAKHQGVVYDYTTANQYTYEMRESKAETWEELQAWWLEIMYALFLLKFPLPGWFFCGLPTLISFYDRGLPPSVKFACVYLFQISSTLIFCSITSHLFSFNLDQQFRKVTNAYKQNTPLLSVPTLLTTHYPAAGNWKPPENTESADQFWVLSTESRNERVWIVDYLKRQREALPQVIPFFKRCTRVSTRRVVLCGRF